MRRYTDSTYTVESANESVGVGETVHYGISINRLYNGISVYIESCSFGNDNKQLPIITPFVSTFI